MFSTATDNQASVEVHVLQGERPLARDNRTLGRFNLVGLAPAPRGVPQVEVTFDIDANGIVNVSARDTSTGTEQKITITGSSGLSQEDVKRMVAEAEQHATDDRARQEVIDARNQADALVYATERAVAESVDRLRSDDKERIERAILAVREAANGDDVAAIRGATRELERQSHAMAEELYSKRRNATDPANDVRDGEVVEGRDGWQPGLTQSEKENAHGYHTMGSIS